MGRDRLASASWAIEDVWAALGDTLVGPTGVVVFAVLVEHPLKVVLPEDENVIQALAPHAPDKAFAVGVGKGSRLQRMRRMRSTRAFG